MEDLLTAEAESSGQLAVKPAPELAAMEPTSPVVLDAEYREIAILPPYRGPLRRIRSVVLPAALATLAICGVPFLLFLLAEVFAR